MRPVGQQLWAVSPALLQVRPLPNVQPVTAVGSWLEGLLTRPASRPHEALPGAARVFAAAHCSSHKSCGQCVSYLPRGGQRLTGPLLSPLLFTAPEMSDQGTLEQGSDWPLRWLDRVLPASERGLPGQLVWLPRALLESGPDALCMARTKGLWLHLAAGHGLCHLLGLQIAPVPHPLGNVPGMCGRPRSHRLHACDE